MALLSFVAGGIQVVVVVTIELVVAVAGEYKRHGHKGREG